MLTKKPLPPAPPSLNEVVHRLAMLGGLLARRGDGEPGVKTLWIGLQRVMNFATGVRFMGDSADSVSWVSWNGPNQGPYAMPQNSTRRW